MSAAAERSTSASPIEVSKLLALLGDQRRLGVEFGQLRLDRLLALVQFADLLRRLVGARLPVVALDADLLQALGAGGDLAQQALIGALALDLQGAQFAGALAILAGLRPQRVEIDELACARLRVRSARACASPDS